MFIMMAKKKTILPTVSENKSLNPLPTALEPTLSTEMSVNPNIQGELISICDGVGATREHLIMTLYMATKATKITLDKHGDEHEEADYDKRIKGTLALLELRGDIKNKSVTQDNRKYTQVIYKWGDEG